MSDDNAPRILIVDDNKHNIKRLMSMLASQGYEVITACDGREALDRAEETLPDLILLDVIMPHLNGFEVTRILRLRSESHNIPILMVTALHDLQDKIQGFDAGADDFLTKPFNAVELLARVRSLLRIKQLHDKLQTRNALLERMLTRYVSEDVVREMLSNPDQNLRLGGVSCEVSVLFADIRGFSRFSEQRKATQVTQVLNYIFHHLAATIFEYQGTLDKYLGDAIMAFYGAPIPSPDHPARALYTAWAMQRRFSQLSRGNSDLDELGLGIGIATGEAVVGNIGTERMMDYTVIGHTPNTAKRLQEHAKAGQILIDEQTSLSVQDIVVTRPTELNLNGSSRTTQVYEVLAVKELVRV